MKLSMWIIANLLESFEPEVHIRRESPRVLRSARLAYATDCVLVQQDGPDCLYLWNEDSIRLPDLSAREGFELLQSLFDSMFDWESRISEAIEQRNFRALVEEMGVVFKNPIALTDANHAVLACSAAYGAEAVDPEWLHLKTYGYSSFTSAKEISEARLSYHMDGKVIRFRFPEGSGMSDSLSISLFQGEMPVGYLTVVEKDHPMNDGHMQLMVMLAKALAPVLSGEQKSSELGNSMLQRFLEGGSLSDEGAQHFLEQRGWTEKDSFRVYILDLDGSEDKLQLQRSYRQYFAAIAAVFPWDLSGVLEGRFVLLANDKPDAGRPPQNQAGGASARCPGEGRRQPEPSGLPAAAQAPRAGGICPAIPQRKKGLPDGLLLPGHGPPDSQPLRPGPVPGRLPAGCVPALLPG